MNKHPSMAGTYPQPVHSAHLNHLHLKPPRTQSSQPYNPLATGVPYQTAFYSGTGWYFTQPSEAEGDNCDRWSGCEAA